MADRGGLRSWSDAVLARAHEAEGMPAPAIEASATWWRHAAIKLAEKVKELLDGELPVLCERCFHNINAHDYAPYSYAKTGRCRVRDCQCAGYLGKPQTEHSTRQEDGEA